MVDRDRVPGVGGALRHSRRGPQHAALVLLRCPLRPGQHRFRRPRRAQRRAPPAGHGVRRPPARRPRDRDVGAERRAAALLERRVGGDRARPGAATLGGQRGRARRDERRPHRGRDPLPAGVGPPRRAGDAARLPLDRRRARRGLDGRRRRRRGGHPGRGRHRARGGAPVGGAPAARSPTRRACTSSSPAAPPCSASGCSDRATPPASSTRAAARSPPRPTASSWCGRSGRGAVLHVTRVTAPECAAGRASEA